MKKKLLNYIKNSPFQKKISIMALVSALLPLLVLTFFSFILIHHFVTEKEKTNNLDNLNAAINQLEVKLASYEDGLNFLVNNNQLVTGLSMTKPTNFEQYHFYTNDIVPLFKNIRYQYPDILSVTLYTSLEFYDHGEYVKKIVPGDLTEHLNINTSIKPAYYYDSDTNELYLYNHLFSKKSHDLNLIVLQLDTKKVFSHLEKLSNDPYTLSIKDQNQLPIYYFSNEKKKMSQDILTKSIQLINKKSLENKNSVKQTHWYLSFSRPYAQINRGFVLLILSALGVFSLAILLLTLFVSQLSKSIVSPLELLAKEMETTPSRNFKLNYYYHSEDEIGQLYKQFDLMLQQIKTLIDEVYEGEITQKKHELRALQSQINPHFFYNSLSLINNKAIMTGNEEISEMALLLSQYYRLSLNNGKHLISIEKELDLTITYAKIQQKMHHYSFDLITNVEADMEQVQMINLLIQPFVENAIFHGIDHIDDQRKGTLTIKALDLNDHFQFVISDNGAGMDEATVLSLFNHSSEHYGLHNVQQRIQLYYGKSDAIHCESKPNKGTTFVITLPKKIVIN